MYELFLFLHSFLRWFLLIALLYSIFRAYMVWFEKSNATATDGHARSLTVITAHIQLLTGLVLFVVSPMVRFLLNNFSTAVKIKEFRFAAIEHTLLMIIAVALITVGAVISKKKSDDKAKFKALAIWFTLALLIIIVAIPWPLSPFGVERPLFRGF